MSEIKLPKLCPRSEIEGKSISKINCKHVDKEEVIILFTDNTFIHIEPQSYQDGSTETELNTIRDDISDYDYEKVLRLADVPQEVIHAMRETHRNKLKERNRLEEEQRERAEYERLKAKYGNQTTNPESRPQPDATSP